MNCIVYSFLLSFTNTTKTVWQKIKKKRNLTIYWNINKTFLLFVIWYSRKKMWCLNDNDLLHSKMTVKSILFICCGLTSIFCIWEESFDSVGVNRIVLASDLGSNRLGKKPFPRETKCEILIIS